MPWHIENDNPDCNGWAVVKDDDGSIAGCHDSEDEAKAQLAALYASEGRMEERVGRVLSNKNENRLRQALDLLAEVLSQLADTDEEAERAIRGLSTSFEQRTVGLTQVEVRAAEVPTIAGYAAVFDRISQPLYGFREKIEPGAFSGLKGADIRALWQHDTARVLGRTLNGSLRIWEDQAGLAFELEPPDTQDGRDALALIGRGDVDQMSFGFTVPKGGDSWSEDKSGYPLRTLKEVSLIEISPVTFPAYLDTSASVVRNAPEWVQRALALGVDDKQDGTAARARMAMLRKRLQLLSMED